MKLVINVNYTDVKVWHRLQQNPVKGPKQKQSKTTCEQGPAAHAYTGSLEP